MLRAVLVLLLVSASAAAAAPVQLAIGSGRATPGGAVAVEVRFDPTDQTAIGAGNDIEFSPLTPLRVSPDGAIDCAASPALGTILPPTFSCLSPPPGPCTRVRALIFRPVGGGTLPPGLFYTCTFLVAPNALAGTSYPLRLLAPRANGAAGRVLPAAGTSGAIEVVAPTATVTASPTPVPSDTPTGTPSSTPTVTTTGTITRTRTVTRTPTRTATPRTPVPTPTATSTPAVVLRAADAVAAPGADARLSLDIADRTGRVSGVTVDLLLPFAAMDARDVAAGCVLAARLTGHALSATPVGDPPTAPELRRLRLVVSEQTVPPRLLGTGPLLTCTAPLRPEAPAGAYPLALDRLFAADVDGTLVLGARGVDGSLTVDAAAASPTPSATPTTTPVPTATRTASPVPPSATRSPSPTAPPSSATPFAPTATPIPASPTEAPTATPLASCPGDCDGDCDGDRAVSIAELVQAIAIANDPASLAECPAIDSDGDATITIDEIVAAVAAALVGCP